MVLCSNVADFKGLDNYANTLTPKRGSLTGMDYMISCNYYISLYIYIVPLILKMYAAVSGSATCLLVHDVMHVMYTSIVLSDH